MSDRKAHNTGTVEDQESAILVAAASEFASVGARRASMDEVAAAAGVSRSTLYRRFPNKEVLLLAVATDTYEKGMVRLEASVAGLGAREAVVEAFAAGAEMVSTDPLLSRMVLEDFEVRNLTAPVNTLFIELVASRVAQTLRNAGATMPDAQLHQAVELHVRLVISYLENPSSDPTHTSPAYARELAEVFLAPMIY